MFKRIIIYICTILTLNFLISSSTKLCGQIPTDGLVAYYTFEEMSGETLIDHSGNSNNGQIYGATWQQVNGVNSLLFDGMNDYVAVPHNSLFNFGTGDFTVEVKYKTSVVPTSSWSQLFSKHNTATWHDKDIEMYVEGGTGLPVFRLSDGTGYFETVTGTTVVTDGIFHTIRGVRQNNKLKIYVDGNLESTVSASINPDNTNPINIGRSSYNNGSGYFDGNISSLAVWNYANSNDGLIAYFPFDGNANNSVSTELNGQIYGATSTDDRFGNSQSSFSFNGTSDYIEIDDPNGQLNFDARNDNYTINVWVKLIWLDAIRDQTIIIDRDLTSNAACSYNINFRGTNGKFMFDMWDQNVSGTMVELFSQTSPKINEWYFLTLKIENKVVRGYVNGVKEAEKTLATNYGSTINNHLHRSIARNSPYYTNGFFHGDLDDIRIYNRALSETEISELYQEGGWTGNRELNTIIITHGFTGEGPIIPINPIQSTKWENLRWQFAMADAVSDNKDIYLIRKGEVYAMDADSLQYADIDADSSIEYVINKYAKPRIISQTKDNIFIFDWTLESAINAHGFAEAAADVLASTLVSLGQKYDFLLRHLHFIGHSRGCVVNSEAIERLVYWASNKILPGGLDLDPEIHMTTLDPHPAGHWAGSLFVPMNDDKVNSDNIGIGVTGWISDSSKVGYIDNYFQTHSLGFIGLEYYPGLSIYNPIANHNLTDFTDANLDAHGLMHTYYYGTVDTTGEKDEFDEGAVVDRNRWYDQGEMGTNQGFYYSRNRKGNQNLSEIYSVESGLNSVKEDTKYGEDYLIFNGNFSKTSYANLIPGWTYQGGSTSNLVSPFFNFCGEVSDTNTLTHNFSFIPLDVDYIYFKMRVGNSSDFDKLQIYLDDVLCDEISITKFMWLFEWQQIKIPDICKGKTSRLSFLITTKDQKYSDVLIDDVGFYKGQKIRGTAACPVNFHIYDNLGNHTGPINDSTIVEEIPGSQYFIQQIDSGDKIKTVYLEPLEQGNFYTFKIESQDTTASFNFVIEDYSDTTKETLLYEYDNIPIEPYTIAKCTVQTSNQIPNLEVDKDGDGNIDTIYTPVIVTTVEEQETRAPLIIMEYNLSQNYPNPFNPTTKISYSLPKSSLVQLKIFNLLGQEIATLVNEEKPAGNYEVNFNASDLSSGVYLYKLQAGDYLEIRKMILLK